MLTRTGKFTAIGLVLVGALGLGGCAGRCGRPRRGAASASSGREPASRCTGATGRGPVHRHRGPGKPIARLGRTGAWDRPHAAARAFLERHGSALGIHDQRGELRIGLEPGGGCRRVGRRCACSSAQGGVPVFWWRDRRQPGCEGDVLSAGGEARPTRRGDRGRWGAPDAARAAVTPPSRARGDRRGLEPSEPRLWVYAPGCSAGPGRPGRTPGGWRARIDPRGPIRETVLVDAVLGNVALHYRRDRARAGPPRVRRRQRGGQRPVRRAGRTAGEQPADWEQADVDRRPTTTPGTPTTSSLGLGRDSLDGAGLPLISTVRYCDPAQTCPYANAFWNGSRWTTARATRGRRRGRP